MTKKTAFKIKIPKSSKRKKSSSPVLGCVLLVIFIILGIIFFTVPLSNSTKPEPTTAAVDASQSDNVVLPTNTAEQAVRKPVSQPTKQQQSAASSCPSTCNKMASCAQAKQCLAQGDTSLDRDGDGIPCETLCKK